MSTAYDAYVDTTANTQGTSRLAPSEQRLAEINDVYITMGLDPSKIPSPPFWTGINENMGGIIFIPMLSNNSQFD